MAAPDTRPAVHFWTSAYDRTGPRCPCTGTCTHLHNFFVCTPRPAGHRPIAIAIALVAIAMIRSAAAARKTCRERRLPLPSRPAALFSTNDRPPADSATIVRGPSLLASTGVYRPSPSLFHLPGLRSLPFWTARGPSSASSEPASEGQRRRHRVAFNDPVVAAAVRHVESNYSAIRSEYFSAVLGQGCETNLDNDDVAQPIEPDYDVAARGGEHAEDALHSGTWDWHSYILNGARSEKFRERCPKTAQVVDDVRVPVFTPCILRHT